MGGTGFCGVSTTQSIVILNAEPETNGLEMSNWWSPITIVTGMS